MMTASAANGAGAAVLGSSFFSRRGQFTTTLPAYGKDMRQGI